MDAWIWSTFSHSLALFKLCLTCTQSNTGHSSIVSPQAVDDMTAVANLGAVVQQSPDC